MQDKWITIPIKIQTKPRPRAMKRGKFIQIYTPSTALKYEKQIAKAYKEQNGIDFGKAPLRMIITFFFKTPKQFPKWKQWAVENEHLTCSIHKDLDNLVKSVLDALNGVAYADDRQVICLLTSKQWTTGTERIEITIGAIPQEPEQQMKEDYKKLKEGYKQWKKLTH